MRALSHFGSQQILCQADTVLASSIANLFSGKQTLDSPYHHKPSGYCLFSTSAKDDAKELCRIEDPPPQARVFGKEIILDCSALTYRCAHVSHRQIYGFDAVSNHRRNHFIPRNDKHWVCAPWMVCASRYAIPIVYLFSN